MYTSRRFKILKYELRQLRNSFLPKRFDSTKIEYSDRMLTRFIAYRVFAHAEIESYLEDRARDTAIFAIKVWKERKITSKVLLSLLAFSGCMMEPPPATLTPLKGSKKIPEEKIKIDKKLDIALASFISCVKGNHGIKETNILSLLLPIGIDCDELDSSWLSTMNAFGESRGLAAHTSASLHRVSQPPNPEIEFKTVNEILKELMIIDALIDDLMKYKI